MVKSDIMDPSGGNIGHELQAVHSAIEPCSLNGDDGCFLSNNSACHFACETAVAPTVELAGAYSVCHFVIHKTFPIYLKDMSL